MDQVVELKKYIRARDLRWRREDKKREEDRVEQLKQAVERKPLLAKWKRSDTSRIAYRIKKRKEDNSLLVRWEAEDTEIFERYNKEDEAIAARRLEEATKLALIRKDTRSCPCGPPGLRPKVSGSDC
jgi:hypothetical protein